MIDTSEFLEDIAGPLGWYYLAAAGTNLGAVWHEFGKVQRPTGQTAIAGGRGTRWRDVFGVLPPAVLAIGFAILDILAFRGHPCGMPESLKFAIDGALGPLTLTLGSLAFLVVLFLGRAFFVRPAVAWAGLNIALLALGLSLADPNFAQVVLKADNVPILAMVFLLGFFTWLGAAQAVKNDERLARGERPQERDFHEKTLVWPDLVYIELIAMVLVSTGLMVWSIGLRAPLEQPANPVVTPNPSKAPWYFLGLQEMLVFFDPPMAGVIIPTLIILGLAAIPYLDCNRKGSGYYTIARRKFAYAVFLFGFLQLWILLILVGTFLRGPNWSFFGLYEPRDPYKVVAQNNVKLAEYFWVMLLQRNPPQAPAGSGMLVRMGCILGREVAGLAVLAACFVGLPILLGRTVLRKYRRRMGRARYLIMVLLLLMMFALPLKMLLHWTVNLSYIVSMPEYFFNF